MAGTKSGDATQLKLLNGKCLFTHCYGHALNLVVGDVIRYLKDLTILTGKTSMVLFNLVQEWLVGCI